MTRNPVMFNPINPSTCNRVAVYPNRYKREPQVWQLKRLLKQRFLKQRFLKQRFLKQTVLLPVAALLLAAVGDRTLAHGAKIDYRTTQALEIQATYDSGDPMAEAQVVVYSPENPSEPWLTGTTDEQGRFIFSPDPSITGNWDVQIRQAGHGDIVSIPIEEADGAIATGEAANTESDQGEADSSVALVSSPNSGSTESLSPLQKGIMAGSVVWGLFGTAMFFTARSKKNAHS